MKALLTATTYYPFGPGGMEILQVLHPDAAAPEIQSYRHELPDAPMLAKSQLRKMSRRIYEPSAVGPDGMGVPHLLSSSAKTFRIRPRNRA